jgi:cystathionine gamma-lyase
MFDDAAPDQARLHDATRVVHAGLPGPVDGEPFLPGPTFASVFHAPGDPSAVRYVYGRYGNPTWERYEAALGALEGGEAVVFPSGMAAVSSVLLSMLQPGDVLTLASDAYYTTRELAQEHLRPRGVEVRMAPTAGRAVHDLIGGTTLLWLETPSNPGLDVCDIAELAGLAHAAGAVVAVDNTLATPLGQRPLDMGADLSVASATKHLTGHADLVLGYVAAADPARALAIAAWRRLSGSIPGPYEVWLAHRSLPTLEMRLGRQCANAQRLAEHLAARPDVERVRYPGLPGDRAHDLASRQMRAFGTVLTFDLGSRERAEAFLGALRLVANVTSFGGLHSSAERRGRWGGDAVPEGFIRFSAGCEDAGDLVADVTSALAAAAEPART